MQRLVIFWLLSVATVYAFSGCVSQKDVRAEVWLNSGIPAALCNQNPEIKKYGSYRRLNDDACKAAGKKPGCVEFMGYCQSEYKNWLSISNTRFEELLKAYLPADSSAAQVSSVPENP